MFEQDYLMKLLLAFYQAMFKSLRRVTDEDEDPKEAADTLDEVVGNAVGMDGASLLSLTPESVVGVLQVSIEVDIDGSGVVTGSANAPRHRPMPIKGQLTGAD